jgi:hypothetical protein
VGTPKGLDLFYEMYMKAKANPDWCALSFNAEETNLPWLDAEELAAARAEMTEAAYRQEFMCDFAASVEDALIPIELAYQSKDVHIKDDEYKFAAKIMGVDVARFGDDKSSIAYRQGLASWEPEEYMGIDNMELASQVHTHILRWKPDAVFIDAGQGQGVIDRLRQLGHDMIIEVPFGGKPGNPKFVNKRSEMWYNIREWMQDGGAIVNNTELLSDLTAPTYDFDTAGRIQLEKKKDMKKRLQRSPDLGDAFALTFAHPVEPRDMSFEQYRDTAIIGDEMVNVGGAGVDSYNIYS